MGLYHFQLPGCLQNMRKCMFGFSPVISSSFGTCAHIPITVTVQLTYQHISVGLAGCPRDMSATISGDVLQVCFQPRSGTHDCIEWLFLAESKQKWLLMTVSLLVPLSQQINRRQLHIAMTALHILVKRCVPTGTVAQSVKTVTWYYLQYTYRQHSLKCKKLERSIFVQLR